MAEVLLESHVRAEFKARWSGWIETYQPGLGGGTGVPDTQIMAWPPLIVPIELKRGEIIAGRLMVDRVRPAQVSWHTRFGLAGGISKFIIGTGTPDRIALHLVSAQSVLANRTTGVGSFATLPSDRIVFTEQMRALLSK